MAAMQTSLTVVLGMHRSGTSLCANLLHELGIDMAEEAQPSPANRRGHWERPRINDLNDRVFAMFGRPWAEHTHALALPPGWPQDPRVQEVRRDLTAWLAARLRPGARFGFKDPRTARLLPMWRAIFTELGVAPRFVFCLRNPAQVARSLTARDQMAREQAEYRWAIYNADAVGGVGADPVCIVPYEDWFAQPAETLARLAAFVEAPVADPAEHAAILARTVDAALRHDAEQPGMAARIMSQRLHRGILRAKGENRFDPDVRAFAALLGEFADLVQPMLVSGEILRASVTEQNRVIHDLNSLVTRLRQAA